MSMIKNLILMSALLFLGGEFAGLRENATDRPGRRIAEDIQWPNDVRTRRVLHFVPWAAFDSRAVDDSVRRASSRAQYHARWRARHGHTQPHRRAAGSL